MNNKKEEVIAEKSPEQHKKDKDEVLLIAIGGSLLAAAIINYFGIGGAFLFAILIAGVLQKSTLNFMEKLPGLATIIVIAMLSLNSTTSTGVSATTSSSQSKCPGITVAANGTATHRDENCRMDWYTDKRGQTHMVGL